MGWKDRSLGDEMKNDGWDSVTGRSARAWLVPSIVIVMVSQLIVLYFAATSSENGATPLLQALVIMATLVLLLLLGCWLWLLPYNVRLRKIRRETSGLLVGLVRVDPPMRVALDRVTGSHQGSRPEGIRGYAAVVFGLEGMTIWSLRGGAERVGTWPWDRIVRVTTGRYLHLDMPVSSVRLTMSLQGAAVVVIPLVWSAPGWGGLLACTSSGMKQIAARIERLRQLSAQ